MALSSPIRSDQNCQAPADACRAGAPTADTAVRSKGRSVPWGARRFAQGTSRRRLRLVAAPTRLARYSLTSLQALCLDWIMGQDVDESPSRATPIMLPVHVEGLRAMRENV